MLLFLLLLNTFAYWTQVGNTIQQTTDSNVNQPGWIVNSVDTKDTFTFQNGCSSVLSIIYGDYQSTKQIELTDDSSLREFYFDETRYACRLIANSEYFPNGFILYFNKTREYPSGGYETEIEVYDKSFTIVTETNPEHFLLKFNNHNNPYLLINSTVTNTISIDIGGFDLNDFFLNTKYVFSVSGTAPTLGTVYNNGEDVSDSYKLSGSGSTIKRFFIITSSRTTPSFSGACILSDLNTHRTSGGFYHPDCLNISFYYNFRNYGDYEDIIIDSDQTSYYKGCAHKTPLAELLENFF